MFDRERGRAPLRGERAGLHALRNAGRPVGHVRFLDDGPHRGRELPGVVERDERRSEVTRTTPDADLEVSHPSRRIHDEANARIDLRHPGVADAKLRLKLDYAAIAIAAYVPRVQVKTVESPLRRVPDEQLSGGFDDN